MVTTKEANEMLPISLKLAADAFKTGYEGTERDMLAEKDRKLKEFLQAKEQANIDRAYQLNAENLRADNARQAAQDAFEQKYKNALLAQAKAKPQLTPAQERYEKAAGEKIANYEVGGGKAGADENIANVGALQKDIQEGNRDWYDRTIGGPVVNKLPSLAGLIVPAEKARSDKARSAAAALARLTDPTPTQALIDQIYSQVYDPSSDDATNLARIKTFQNKLVNSKAQMENAVSNLNKTGYAGSIGESPQPASPPPMSFKEFQKAKREGKL